MKKGWCHVPIPLTQGPVPLMDPGSTFVLCKNGCQRTGGTNSHKRTCAGEKALVAGWAGHLGYTLGKVK